MDDGQRGSQTIAPQVAILLDGNDDRFAIYLRLPAFPGVADSDETIEIHSGLGVRTYPVRALGRSRLIPVTLRMPLVEVFASSPLGLSGAAKAVIDAGINAFRKEGSFFRLGDSGGRLLAPSEPLEWGDKYNLLTQRKLPSESDIFGISVDIIYEKQEWLLYELTLPGFEWAAANEAKGAVERYLNRRIIPPRPRAYFISPPPHHVELDGTHVFPDGTQQVMLRTVGVGDICIRPISDSERFHIEHDNETCRVSISEGEVGDFAVQTNGRDLATGRIESCPAFTPRGVQVLADGHPFDIFLADLPSLVFNRVQQKIEITFPTERVARFFEAADENWKREGASSTLSSRGRKPGFDAKNFGSLAWPLSESVAAKPAGVDGQLVARRIWISGLIARFAEGEAPVLNRLQAYSTDSERSPRIDSLELEWLRPYVAVAWPD